MLVSGSFGFLWLLSVRRLRHGTYGLDASACLLPWCVLVRVLHSCQASSRWRECYTWMGEPIYPTLAKRAHRFPTCPTLTTTAFPTHATIASTQQTRYSETLTRTTSVTRTCQLEAGWASDFDVAGLQNLNAPRHVVLPHTCLWMVPLQVRQLSHGVQSATNQLRPWQPLRRQVSSTFWGSRLYTYR